MIGAVCERDVFLAQAEDLSALLLGNVRATVELLLESWMNFFSRLIRMGNETSLEVLEDITVAAPTSARKRLQMKNYGR